MDFSRLLRASRLICSTLLIAVFLPASTYAQTKSQDPALELQTLEDFHAAELMSARKPVNEVDEGYRAKLEKHQKTAQAAGDLKGVLAAKQAIADLDAGRPPASDDPAAAAIQKAYIPQRQKAVAASEQAVAKIEQAHLASLKKLVVDLTKAGHIEEAMKAQAKVDKLAAAPEAMTAPAQVAAAGVQDIEIWKKKAQEEFPALKDPASPLSKQLKALLEQKKSTPSFFSNSQWPYLLAKEADSLGRNKQEQQKPVFLDDLKEAEVNVGWGSLGKHGGDGNGGPALVNRLKPEHSLFTHARENGSCFVIYDLAGQYSTFSGTATVADDAHMRSLRFRIKGDGKTLWRSRIIETGKDADEFNVSVQGVNKLELEVECPESAIRAWSMWVSPKLMK